MPTLSVCIPVYNGAKYIGHTIENVLNQSFKDIELVLIDDASKDDSVKIIESFQDDRIRLVKNETNNGLNRNFTRCIEEASGKYIQILCMDDTLKEGALAKKVEMFEQNEEVVLTFSASQVINSHGKVAVTRRFAKRSKVVDGKWLIRKAFHRRNIFCEPSNVMVRASVAKSVGGYNEQLPYSLDWEYWSRVCVNGKVGYVSDILMDFIIEPGTTSYRMIQDKELMRKDEKLFVECIRKIEGLHIGGYDVFLHKVSSGLRGLAKRIYVKLFN